MTVLPHDSLRDEPVDATAAAEYFFAGARDAGLAHVVLSPGSRSTALSLAVTRTPDLSYSIELDERVAAFVALGYAATSGKPVALVCTSGTAAANYLPAVAEASLSNVPLVVITSDRPPEHQHWGVGQSFDQRGLYHRQVRDEITMPVGGDGGARFSMQAGTRSVVTAVDAHGPVHVNWPFRLPIEPSAPPIDPPDTLGTTARTLSVRLDDVEVLGSLLQKSQAPLILAGPHTIGRRSHRADAERLLAAASSLGIPVLADVLSGLRGGGNSSEVLIAAPALVVTAPSVPEPDLVIRLGQTPTAKVQRLWWEQLDVEHVLIDPLDDWHDPSHLATTRLTSPPADLLDRVATEALTTEGVASAAVARPEWVAQWTRAGEVVSRAIDETLVGWSTTTEAHVARALSNAGTTIDRVVVSSSMPVRDLDTFARVQAAPRALGNRGINGIDGVISTAIGAQLASNQGRTYVLVGDVAALHDIGGLLSAGRNGVPLTVVIVNNDGGGIFSLLPIRDALDDGQFNELFHTPHGTSFNFLRDHPGIDVVQAADVRNALIETRNHDGVVVLEVTVDTPERMAFADALREAIGSLPTS